MSFVALIAFAPGVLVAVATVVKLREVRIASRYRATSGVVVTSGIESRRRVGLNEKPMVENFPKIVFEYEVGQRKYKGHRISVAEEKGNFLVESTLERYPVGREVTVYFDPTSPGTSVLERDLPPEFWKGMWICFGLFFGVPAFFVLEYSSIPRHIAALLPHPERAGAVTLACTVTLVFLMFAAAFFRQVAAERRYLPAKGRIVGSTTREFELVDSSDLQRTRTRFRADIEYSYRVGDREYRGNTRHSNVDVVAGAASSFSRLLRKYEKGREVTIYYDPREPSVSVLERTSIAAVVASLFTLAGIAWILYSLGVLPAFGGA